MIKKITLLTFILSFNISFSSAENNCTDIENDREMGECAYKKFKEADEILNIIYKQTYSFLKEQQQQNLKESQKSWIAFKESDCQLIADRYKGGSLRPYVMNNCLTNKTNTRINELKYIKELWEEVL